MFILAFVLFCLALLVILAIIHDLEEKEQNKEKVAIFKKHLMNAKSEEEKQQFLKVIKNFSK